MPTYSASDIIGKTLYAAKRLPVYAGDLTTILGYAEQGQPIGEVYSWVGGQNGQPLFWMFIGTNWPTYYVRHNQGDFDFDRTQQELIIDGSKTTEEQVKDALERKEIAEKGAIRYYLEKYGGIALLTYVGVTVFKEFMENNRGK